MGASVRGAQPQGTERLGRIGQKLSSIKPNSPARAKLRQLTGSSLGTSTMAVGCVMTLPAPQISQTGKPGDGGSGALTGAGVVGVAMVGLGLGGASSQQAAAIAGITGQKEASMNPCSPAVLSLPQEMGSSFGTSIIRLGCITIRPSPQMLQAGNPGDGGTGPLTGAGVGIGAPEVGLGLGGASSQQAPAMLGRMGQKEASMNPCSPAVLSLPQEMGSSFGTSTIRSGCITIRPSPQMLQAGKPGDGGMGPLTGAGVVWEVTGTGGLVGAGLGGKTPHAQGMEKNPTRLQRLGEMRPF